MDLIKNFYFSIFLFAIIVLFDLLIKFKRPLLLKFYLSLFVTVIGAAAFFRFIENETSFFVFYYAVFRATSVVCILNIFAILYFPKTAKWVYLLTIVSFLTIVYFLYLSHILPKEFEILNKRSLFIIRDHDLKIPFGFKVLRFFIVYSFVGLMFYYCYNIIKRYRYDNIYYDKIRKWTIYFLILCMMIAVFYVPLNIYNSYQLLPYYLNIFTYSYVLLLLYYRPNFLNRSALKISFGDNFKRDTEYAISELEFINEFYTKLYFTKNDASLENLAKLLNISSNDLYKFIYYKYSMTFNDLVNKNRVDYFIDIIHNPKYLNYTIDALAKEAGFSSRQHLYKPFKKFHGGNPSDIVDAIAV